MDRRDLPDRLKKYQTDRGETTGSGSKASEAEESFDKAMKNLSGRLDRNQRKERR
jgi:hypothetical protein